MPPEKENLQKKQKRFEHVGRITRKHSARFVAAFTDGLRGAATLTGAIEDSGIMTWPSETDCGSAGRTCEHQEAILYFQDVIGAQILDRITPALSEAFEQSATEVLGLKPSERRAAQLRAIRSFFTDPKESYTVSELEAIYGDNIPDVRDTLDFKDDQTSTDRQQVADFLNGYVPPVTVGRALAGLSGPLTIETRSIELPQWMWEALDKTARTDRCSVSEALSYELLSCLEGLGFTATFDDAAEPLLPDYNATSLVG